MTTQHAPWSAWIKREAEHLYRSFLRQWNLWRMWRLPIGSEEFKARFREHLSLNRRCRP